MMRKIIEKLLFLASQTIEIRDLEGPCDCLWGVWGRLGKSWCVLGSFWACIGCVLARQGESWRRLGAILGRLGPILGGFGGVLEAFWEVFKIVFERFVAIFGNTRKYQKTYENQRATEKFQGSTGLLPIFYVHLEINSRCFFVASFFSSVT